MDLNGKKILITGADGFIGSHLVERLLEENCQIKAFVYYNSFNSWGWLDTFSKNKLKNIEVFAGDVRDCNGVKTATKDIDVVFHLAALIGIPFSYHSPDSYVDTNIKGTLNVLQACREYVERAIVTSTSEVYGTAQYVPIDEKHPFQGQSPYSASKIGADRIAESFHRSFAIPVVIARPFNTYGDICNGFIALAECDDAVGKEINIGSQTEISIGNLANLLIELMGINAKIVAEDKRKRPGKSEVERLVCNNSLLKKLTGWEPKTSLREGLLKTIEWFRDEEKLQRYKSDVYNI